jgi:Protein of unknown function (DUF2794)
MGTVLPFPGPVQKESATSGQIGFQRSELNRIVDLYGRMVAAGLWKDYAIELRPDAAAFWAFRRTAERPEYKIEKRPGGRHGAWTLIGDAGQVLRRGHELGPVLAPIERRLLKLVAE